MRSKFKWIFTLLLALTMQFSFAQEKTITGVVSDASGPLPGVNVAIKGTKKGVSTGFDGKYSIKAKEGETLVFSFMGMREVSKVVGASGVMNTVMQSDAKQIGEIVVVAQGRSKDKKSIGYDVATLKGSSLENKPQTDVVRSLQGKMTGVQITNTGGMAGSTSNIVVRGNKSITGSAQPLFVVDGVPFDVSAGDVTGDFNQGASSSSSRFLDIDSNNIESVSVLKGLAASVTYGSQGRNGVILITTKKGKKSEKINVNYSTNIFVSQVANLPEYQNKYGGGSAFNAGGGTIGNWGAAFDNNLYVANPYDQSSITPYFPEYSGATVQWKAAENNVKDFFKTGLSYVHNLGINGGSENVQFAVNGTYSNENGMVEHNSLNKYNFGGNVSVKVSDKLKISGGLTYFNTKYETPPVSASNGDGTESIFKRLLYLPRNFDIMNYPFQNPVTGASIYYRSDLTNPRWLLENSRSIQNVNRIFGNFSLNYAITKSIGLNYKFGLDRYVDEQLTYTNKGAVEKVYVNGYMRTVTGTNSILNQDLVFDLKQQNLFDKFGVSASLGFNSRRDTYSQSGISSQNQLVFGQVSHQYFATQSTNDPFAGNLNLLDSWSNILGVYGVVDFSYDDYLYLNLQGRQDYGSVVESKNQKIFYPSASLSFIPTNAFKGIKGDILGYWKLRAAYGTSAGYPGLYRTRDFVSFNSNVFNGQSSQTVGNRLGNPDLKPELHKEFEIGTDLEMFNGKIVLGASVYKRISENQIVSRSLDPSSGYTSTYINAGRIDNKGIEASLALTPIKNENFDWTLTTMFTKNVSEVVSLPEGQERINIAGFSNGIGNYAIVGQPYGVIVGSYNLKDPNGNYIINPSNGTVIRNTQVGLRNEIIGNPNPDYSISFNNSITYKNFNLSGLIEFVKGGQFYSNTIENLLRRGVTRDTEDREGTYVIPGSYGDPKTGELLLDSNGNAIPNTVQVSLNDVYFTNLVDANSASVFDATRLRLREVSLGYNLPNKFLKGTGVSSLSFSLTGQNLWLKAFNIPKYTNVDPELISTGTGNGKGLDFQTAPQSRRFGFSLKIGF